MKILKTLPTLLLVSLLATTSQAAGLFVEPLVTYEGSSKTEIDWPTPWQNSSGSVEGLGIGARLGMHAGDILLLAADVRYSKPQFKDSSNNIDTASNQYNYGLMVGAQTPFLGIRVFGTYILGGELNPDEDNSVDAKFTEGTGYRVGAGVHFAFVSVNLEYQDMKYNKTTLESVGPFAGPDLDYDLTNKSYILSVGFPFEF
ncbi:hypothetical protein AZI86_05015 [Bdellovibrio bacteriovorus]|uniref:Outer membrane protein beta-barrel domain-containing protein n=1 Tax=Bdellovibrio bacteriovorus TaxID=959 RepID=A0A150WPK0_BDEBC|nr:outer membrane beta-barrel protein [Bdellovibrio bacteriovorus]KYG66412.1 hypothetical protein AZI86_05015 [Bdellovibrio bacteriovorus]